MQDIICGQKLLHFVYLGYDYFIERRKLYASQMSKRNIENGWGAHNFKYEKMTRDEYNLLAKDMKKVL